MRTLGVPYLSLIIVKALSCNQMGRGAIILTKVAYLETLEHVLEYVHTTEQIIKKMIS